MSLFRRGLIGLAALLSFLASASADQDPIPVVQWTPGDPTTVDFFFSNDIHPPPSEKVFQFVGDATSLLVAPTTFDILIYFDYIDGSGATVIIPPVPFGYHNVVPADGMTHHIEAGPYILPFCPEQVSIHFEIISEVPIQFDGLYDHTCIPVPELNTAALFGLGAIGLFVVRCCRRGK
jgi:hypothetical protein